MPYETILFDISDRVACITLNRPEKLNAFTARMHEELHDALKQVYAGDARPRVADHRQRARVLRRSGPQ